MQSTSAWKEVLTKPKAGAHILQTYREESFLVEAVSYFVGEGLVRGEAVILIATPEHESLFVERLTKMGLDVKKAIQRHQLYIMDAKGTLAAFMRDGLPSWDLFERVIGNWVREAQLRYPSVRAYGEMMNILWQDGERAAAGSVESYWNKLSQRQNFSLLCAYAIDPLNAEFYDGSLQSICKCHTHFIPYENYAGIEEAVGAVGQRILGASLASMVKRLSMPHHMSTEMPPTQATLFFLSEHMPLSIKNIFSKVQQHYDSHCKRNKNKSAPDLAG